jgi:hypothetical protein
MYNKKRKPMNPTGCGNFNCPIRQGCERADMKQFHFVSTFHPNRLADGRVSCAMRLEKVA